MTVRRTWMSLLLLGCVLAVPHCDSRQNAELDGLAVHNLDLSRDAVAGPLSADPRRGQVVAPDPRWEPAAYRPWRHIVIHHSSSRSGNAALFDQWHRARGWDGLGYHFVIDNGDGGPDGYVEVGQRWGVQKWGSHTGNTPDNEYNNFGIGICLVGDFAVDEPTPSQLASLRKLVAFLAERYDIGPGHVIGHRDAPNANTTCPGDSLWRYVHGPLRGELARKLSARNAR